MGSRGGGPPGGGGPRKKRGGGKGVEVGAVPNFALFFFLSRPFFHTFFDLFRVVRGLVLSGRGGRGVEGRGSRPRRVA